MAYIQIFYLIFPLSLGPPPRRRVHLCAGELAGQPRGGPVLPPAGGGPRRALLRALSGGDGRALRDVVVPSPGDQGTDHGGDHSAAQLKEQRVHVTRRKTECKSTLNVLVFHLYIHVTPD